MDVLNQHPDLMPSVLKALSDALTASRERIQELERRVAEQRPVNAPVDIEGRINTLTEENARLQVELGRRVKQERTEPSLSPSCCEANDARIAQLQSELSHIRRQYDEQVRLGEELRAAYETEKSAGDKLRTTLQDRYLELRNKETTVESQGQAIAQQLAAFTQTRSEWAAKDAVHEQAMKVLRDLYRNSLKERDALQAKLKDQTSGLDAQESALKSAITERDVLTARLEGADKNLQRAETCRLDGEAAREKLSAEINAIRAEKNQLQRDTHDLLRGLEREKHDRKASEKISKDRESLVIVLQQENERFHTKIQNLTKSSTGELTRLRAELTQVTVNLDMQSARNVELQKRCRNIRDDGDGLQEILLARISSAEGTIDGLREENARLLRESSSLAGHAEMVRDDLMEQLDRQRTANLNLRGELEDVKDKYEQRKVEHFAMTEANDADLAKLREENKNLRASVLKAAAEAKEQLQQSSSKEREELRAAVNAYKKKNAQLQKDLGKVVATRDDMGRQLSALSSSSAMYANWKADQLNEKMEQERVRLLYHQFMAKYPTPMDRPTFANVQPVGRIKSPGELEFFTHNQPNSRPHVHFPKRMHWCAKDIHAIVYHPTHEYLPLSNQWVTPPSIMSLAGQTFDLFVTRKNFVCYAGIYTLHSLRQVHLPGSPIPTDVCPAAIQHAAGIAKDMSLKIVECFPGGQIKTECFGLQCLGFDKVLYEVLRRRFQVLETPNTKSDANTMKRRADGIDLRQGAQKPRLL